MGGDSGFGVEKNSSDFGFGGRGDNHRENGTDGFHGSIEGSRSIGAIGGQAVLTACSGAGVRLR